MILLFLNLPRHGNSFQISRSSIIAMKNPCPNYLHLSYHYPAYIDSNLIVTILVFYFLKGLFLLHSDHLSIPVFSYNSSLMEA